MTKLMHDGLKELILKVEKKSTEFCSIGSVIIMMISGLAGNLISMKKRGIKVWVHHWHWANEV